MHDRFLRACRREPTDVTPVWFMRQAGRYMAEYRALRAKHTLLEHLQDARARARGDAPAAPPRAWTRRSSSPTSCCRSSRWARRSSSPRARAPSSTSRCATAPASTRLRVFEPEEGLGYVLEAVRLIRRELDGKTPLIGFAGAPFTIASYLIEGGKSSDYRRTKQLMWTEPEALVAAHGQDLRGRAALPRARRSRPARRPCSSSTRGSARSRPQDYREHVLPHVRHILDGRRERRACP